MSVSAELVITPRVRITSEPVEHYPQTGDDWIDDSHLEIIIEIDGNKCYIERIDAEDESDVLLRYASAFGIYLLAKES